MSDMKAIWGWDGTKWGRILIDAPGHLQVDTLSSALPAGAATAANQATIIGHIDTLETISGRCYGYDTANWQYLQVEAAALHNLRVKLYDGANGIDSDILEAAQPLNVRGLVVISSPHLSTGAGHVAITRKATNLDNIAGFSTALPVGAYLMGFDGATWDRLRTYGTGILKVGRAEVGLLTVRKTAVGQVGAAGARKLYWMTMNPTAANSVVELTNDTDGSTAVVWDMTHGTNSAHHMNLDPPMEFTNGIWLKTLTNLTSIIFGYL